MTREREKAIEILEEIIDEGWLISDFDKCIAIDACEMAIEAIKALEILDKIRAEIDGLTYGCEVHPRTVIDDVLAIIDKYKSESEDKE